jgi:hypothetical protein
VAFLSVSLIGAKSAGALPAGTERSAAGFYHPGVLVNRAQLDFIKGKAAAGAETWKSANLQPGDHIAKTSASTTDWRVVSNYCYVLPVRSDAASGIPELWVPRRCNGTEVELEKLK